jgi:Cu+-exporting ATPase
VLNRLPGVSASVNLASERAQVDLSAGASSPKEVVAAIEKAGFGVPQQALRTGDRRHDLRRLLDAP